MRKHSGETMLSVVLFLLIGFLTVNQVHADTYKVKREYRQAVNLYKKAHFNLSLQKCLQLLEKDPDNAAYNYSAGMCYYYIAADCDSAIYYLTLASKNVTLFYSPKMAMNTGADRKAPVDVFYYLGLCYMRSEKLSTAINYFKHYMKYFDQNNKNQKNIFDNINMQVEVCEREREIVQTERSKREMFLDSLYHEIEFREQNYLQTSTLLLKKTEDYNELKRQLESYQYYGVVPQQSPTLADSHSIITSIDSPSNMNTTATIYPNTTAPPSTTSAKVNSLNTFTVQIYATKENISISRFSAISDVKKCYMPDGMYRITSGEFNTREEANAYCKTIQKMGYPDAWIRPSLGCR